MSIKTNKSYSKRLKVTKTGKLKARKPGFNHFNAKQSRATQLGGRVATDFTIKPKAKSRMLPGVK